MRVYSSDTIYGTYSEAQKVCADTALEQGLLEYIKHGNGQAHRPAPENPDEEPVKTEENEELMYTSISLQSFYESLPQPFPEPVGEKTAVEINSPGWLNTTIQNARGGKLTVNFTWINDLGCKSYSRIRSSIVLILL